MRRSWRCLVGAALMVIAAPLLGGSAAAANLRIGGSGCALELMRILAGPFQDEHPQVGVTVFPSLGSSGGIKALLAGALDLALSSRPLQEQEKAQGLQEIPLFKTPYAFVANAGVGQAAVTTGELENIYGGRLLSWPDGSRIRVVLRPRTETDTEVAMSLSPGMRVAVSAAMAREGMILAVTDQENLDTIGKIPGSLGSATLSQILSEKRQVKILTLDGRRPSAETLSAGGYPLSKVVYLVAKPKAGPEPRLFLEFCRSPQGAALIRKYGGVPLADHKAAHAN